MLAAQRLPRSFWFGSIQLLNYPLSIWISRCLPVVARNNRTTVHPTVATFTWKTEIRSINTGIISEGKAIRGPVSQSLAVRSTIITMCPQNPCVQRHVRRAIHRPDLASYLLRPVNATPSCHIINMVCTVTEGESCHIMVYPSSCSCKGVARLRGRLSNY